MKTVLTHFLATLAAVAVTAAASAQQADIKVAQDTESRCRKEVRDYLQTIRYVRDTAGSQIGDRIVEGLVSEQELARIIASAGPCAGVQLLRERRIPK